MMPEMVGPQKLPRAKEEVKRPGRGGELGQEWDKYSVSTLVLVLIIVLTLVLIKVHVLLLVPVL